MGKGMKKNAKMIKKRDEKGMRTQMVKRMEKEEKKTLRKQLKIRFQYLEINGNVKQHRNVFPLYCA